MKQMAIFILVGLFSQAEGCCFWKSKNKITPVATNPLSIHQRDLSSDTTKAYEYNTVHKSVYHLPLAMVRTIHLDPNKNIVFKNVSAKGKAMYLGLIAQRFAENSDEMQKLDEQVMQGNERYRRIIVAPKAHAFHLNRKRTKLPTIFVSPASLENTPEESKTEEVQTLFPTTSSTEQSPKD